MHGPAPPVPFDEDEDAEVEEDEEEAEAEESAANEAELDAVVSGAPPTPPKPPWAEDDETWPPELL